MGLTQDVAVTVEGSEPVYCLLRVGAGRDHAGVIELPRGAERVIIFWAPTPYPQELHDSGFLPWLREWLRRAPGAS